MPAVGSWALRSGSCWAEGTSRQALPFTLPAMCILAMPPLAGALCKQQGAHKPIFPWESDTDTLCEFKDCDIFLRYTKPATTASSENTAGLLRAQLKGTAQHLI